MLWQVAIARAGRTQNFVQVKKHLYIFTAASVSFYMFAKYLLPFPAPNARDVDELPHHGQAFCKADSSACKEENTDDYGLNFQVIDAHDTTNLDDVNASY